MNKEIFEDVAQQFCDYCADYYDSGYVDEPEDYRTADGYLGLFQNWLEGIVEQDPDNEDIAYYEHVLDNFDEVEVEEIEDGVFIPVINDSESTGQYMEGQ